MPATKIHLSLEFKTASGIRTEWHALEYETLYLLNDWMDSAKTPATAADAVQFMKSKGLDMLDRADSPATIAYDNCISYGDHNGSERHYENEEAARIAALKSMSKYRDEVIGESMLILPSMNKPLTTELKGYVRRIEEYYRDNLRHRDNGPAYIEIRNDGTTIEEYHHEGKLHRIDAPAYIRVNFAGWRTEEYHHEGKLHRDNGPAIIETRPNGARRETYYRNGEIHRADGPAVVVTTPEGTRKGNSSKDHNAHLSPLPSIIEIPGITLHRPPTL